MPTLSPSTLTSGASLDRAKTALVLLHGRGAGGPGILGLADALDISADWAVVAPQAPAELGGSWYPHRFTAELFDNEPWLSRALSAIAEHVAALEAAGISSDRIVLAGFSQGACLAAEFALRNARRWGAVLVFSGGLIGPPGTKWNASASLSGTPVLLAGSDNDPHIPLVRVEESGRVFSAAQADVTTDLHRGMQHTIAPASIEIAQNLLRASKLQQSVT